MDQNIDKLLIHDSSLLQSPPSNALHQYGTRIRSHSIIKPSSRMRQSSNPPQAPRRIKPIPIAKPPIIPGQIPDLPPFPPPHVTLHPDDANSKVFLAIGRSFLSVNNCAMTIKDLAEMTLSYGLVCQNVSAAGQAITTYIRNHIQRCEEQQDHPLLLRHVLSGTPSDDDLLHALHSRTGGAHCTINSETRTTNFRRGTMVWYLSKATGAPCPFARAGVRLCEYGENGKVGIPSAARDKKRERDRQRRAEACGQKRKRFLRGYSGIESGSESSGEEEKRLPKVKLTLRLKPRNMSSESSGCATPVSSQQEVVDLSKDSDSDDSRDDSMSVDSSDDEEPSSDVPVKPTPWCMPQYSRRPISISGYTPSFSASSPDERRSPSESIGSPPPDSEDEDDDYHISMTMPSSRRNSADAYAPAKSFEQDVDWDLDFESDPEEDIETDTQWDSPAPQSPAAPHGFGDVSVKVEHEDVRHMLDAWESLDRGLVDAKVVEVVAQAAAGMYGTESSSKVKVEELDHWNWEDAYSSASSDWYGRESPVYIKQEEIEFISTFTSDPLSRDALPPFSPVSAASSLPSPSSSFGGDGGNFATLRRNSELVWKNVELLGPDTVNPQDFEVGSWQDGKGSGTIRARSKTSPSLPAFTSKSAFSFSFPVPQLESTPPPMTSLSSLAQSFSLQRVSSPEPHIESQTSVPVAGPSKSTVQPERLSNEVVFVHTCQPCIPAVSATQVEGIPVYQMLLGSALLLRRIDTDFVNLTPMINHLGLTSSPVSTTPGATMISEGSFAVRGIWVPLPTAQVFAKGYTLPDGLLDVFLSDSLFERFPSALQDFHRSNAPGRMLTQFGPHFKSTLDAQSLSLLYNLTAVSGRQISDKPWGREQVAGWNDEDRLLSIHPPLAAGLDALRAPLGDDVMSETPLTSKEQEMFHELCVIPEWEKENVPSMQAPSVSHEAAANEEELVVDILEEDPVTPTATCHQPLRRSRRVANANAVAALPRPNRVPNRRRGTRNCLA